MTTPRILIGGIGNIFLGDDGFGVEVVRRLATRPLPSAVKATDFGIRGFDLAYALLQPYDLVILVDTAIRGSPPGTIQVIEPALDDLSKLDAEVKLPQTHAMVPSRAVEMALGMGAIIRTLRLVSCEPATFGEEGVGHLGLSEPVALAVNEAVAVTESLVAEFLNCPCTS